MTGIAVGGPTPAPVASTVPADSAGKQAVEQARQAAVSSVKQRDRDSDRDQPPVAYGVKGNVDTREASANYDARGRVREEQENERGGKVDRRA